MAKFKINTSLITPLTDMGFIDGSGNVTVTFAGRSSGQSSYYKVTFVAASDIIETTNDRMVKAIQQMAPPAIQVNGTWIIGNPGNTKLFESVADADPNPTIDPATSGTQQITAKEKNLVVRYAKATGDGPIPAGRDKATLTPWVAKASKYFGERNKTAKGN